MAYLVFTVLVTTFTLTAFGYLLFNCVFEDLEENSLDLSGMICKYGLTVDCKYVTVFDVLNRSRLSTTRQ
jgi:hypothetical protein